jgi:hypothetical protein
VYHLIMPLEMPAVLPQSAVDSHRDPVHTM